MKKHEFLEELRRRLAGLSEADITESVAYYEEMIEDRIEDGLTEEDAVREIGTPADAASYILKEMPLGKLIKARMKPKQKLPIWAIILLCLGSPVWASLLLAFVIVVISVYTVIWSVIAVLWAVDLTLAIVGFALILLCPLFCVRGFGWTGLASLGVGILLIGFGIFFFSGSLFATKGICLLSKKVFLLIKRSFMRKEAVQ